MARTPTRKSPTRTRRRVVRKPRVQKNLNDIRTDSSPKHMASVSNVTVHFDHIGTQLKALLETVPFVCVACCWVTSSVILKALKDREGVAMVISKSKMAKYATPYYKALTPLDDKRGAVRLLGSERKGQQLMHEKFCVGLDANKTPLWVAYGSYNYSASGMRNLENLVVAKDVAFAHIFKNEFDLLWKKSRKFI